MKFSSIAFVVVMAFAVLGFIVFGTTIHEFSHFQDYKEIAKKGNICIFNIPTNGSELFKSDAMAGNYAFSYAKKDEAKVLEIRERTEFKAYFIMAILTLLFFICYVSVIKQRKKLLAKDI